MYTLGDIPRKGSILFPDQVAVVFEDVRLTYRQLNDRVNRLAQALSGMGCRQADRLTVLGENTHKYLEVYFAAAKLGMSVTPLNFRLSDQEIIHIVNDSEASCFLVADGYEERVIGFRDQLTGIKDWITLDRPMDGCRYYEKLLEDSSQDEPGLEVDEEEMAVLMYTGGTTGLPKGVILTHRAIMTGAIAAAIGLSFSREDSTCFILPLFHVSFWPALAVLLVGGKVVVNRRPDLNGILQLIQDEKCTHINAVPTIYSWMIQLCDLKAFDLSSLRSISYAGSPFPPEQLKQAIAAFGPKFTQIYAMTECVGGTMLWPEDHVLEGERSILLSSAGKPGMTVDLCVLGDDDQPLKAGEIGEVALKGKCAMSGYWKNPQLTAKTLRGGWYHTGDMGYLDHDGYLFLVDRKADMIVTGGENVYPKETEDVLYQHPAVAMAAVVSAPDDKWGEKVQAVVVLKQGQSVAEAELIAHCKERLAGYKCPKAVDFWDKIPTTAVGKILRKDVKLTFWEGHGRSIG
jgi:acyl-CoA synthetase (AMP-forming)/AMP-acid ligase II